MKKKIIRFADGSHARIDIGGRWALELPTGRVVGGIASDLQAACQQVERAHDKWAIERWNHGTPAEGGLFVCSLR